MDRVRTEPGPGDFSGYTFVHSAAPPFPVERAGGFGHNFGRLPLSRDQVESKEGDWNNSDSNGTTTTTAANSAPTTPDRANTANSACTSPFPYENRPPSHERSRAGSIRTPRASSPCLPFPSSPSLPFSSSPFPSPSYFFPSPLRTRARAEPDSPRQEPVSSTVHSAVAFPPLLSIPPPHSPPPPLTIPPVSPSSSESAPPPGSDSDSDSDSASDLGSDFESDNPSILSGPRTITITSFPVLRRPFQHVSHPKQPSQARHQDPGQNRTESGAHPSEPLFPRSTPRETASATEGGNDAEDPSRTHSDSDTDADTDPDTLSFPSSGSTTPSGRDTKALACRIRADGIMSTNLSPLKEMAQHLPQNHGHGHSHSHSHSRNDSTLNFHTNTQFDISAPPGKATEMAHDSAALQAHILLLDAAAAILSEDTSRAASETASSHVRSQNPHLYHHQPDRDSTDVHSRARPQQPPFSLADLDASRREQQWLSNRIDVIERKLAVQRRVRDAALLVQRIGRDSVEREADRAHARNDAIEHCERLEKELGEAERRLLRVQNRIFRAAIAAAVGFAGPQLAGHPAGAHSPLRHSHTRQPALIPDQWDPESAFCSAEQLKVVFPCGATRPGAELPVAPSPTAPPVDSASARQLAELDNHIGELERRLGASLAQNGFSRSPTFPAGLDSSGTEPANAEIKDVEVVMRSLHRFDQQLSAALEELQSARLVAQQHGDMVDTITGLWQLVRTTELEQTDSTSPHPIAHVLSDPTFSLSRFSTATQHILASRAEAGARQREQLANIAAYKTDIDVLQSDLAASRSALAAAKEELAVCQRSVAALEASRDKAVTELSAAREEEIPRLESELIRVQTALTICRAELDRGDGPRSERVARDHQLDDLANRNSELVEQMATQRVESEKEMVSLRRELATLLRQFEALTKAGLGAEKERSRLEGHVECLTEKVHILEGHLADERVRLLGRPRVGSGAHAAGYSRGASPDVGDGVQSQPHFQPLAPAGRAGEPAGAGRRSSSPAPLASSQKELPAMPTDAGADGKSNEGTIGAAADAAVIPTQSRGMSPMHVAPEMENIPTQVLRAEFKKMMRDVRAEGLRALKAEQAERKRLEAELRAFRMEKLEAAAASAASAAAATTTATPAVSPRIPGGGGAEGGLSLPLTLSPASPLPTFSALASVAVDDPALGGRTSQQSSYFL